MEWNSEYGEDKWIAENIDLPASGVYVDVGAGHPDTHSNTAFLRRMGWTGLAIDGNPSWGQYWKTPFVAAVIGCGGDPVGFHIDENPWISRIKPGATEVIPATMEFVLRSHGIDHIDFLSLDVEGAEFDAFISMNRPIEKWPDVILSEYNTLGKGADFRLTELLIKYGDYTMVRSTQANIIYKRRL